MPMAHGDRAAIPTMDDLNHAEREGMTLVAIAARNFGPACALRLVLESSGDATVCLDLNGVRFLAAALRGLFPNLEWPQPSPARESEIDGDRCVQVGHLTD
jgi:hypothetical protein